MKAPFTIEKLSAQEGTWRIDWFGDVAYPDLSKRQSQPSVAVQLSQNQGFSGEIKKREEWLPAVPESRRLMAAWSGNR